ncbi:MAG: LamG domain-containing protein [Bacteroidetes bacterium]|nr:MAG: LamG domain-containing protein [Bacteroidota bacterium]
MKTREFADLVQKQVEEGKIEHAISLLLSFFENQSSILYQDILLLDEQYQDYQRKKQLGLPTTGQEVSHINFCLVEIAKELPRYYNEITCEQTRQRIAQLLDMLQQPSPQEEEEESIAATKSTPSSLISMLGIGGALALFLLGALLHKPMPASLDEWIQEDEEVLMSEWGKEIELKKGLLAFYPFDLGMGNEASGRQPVTVHQATFTADRFGSEAHALEFDGQHSWVELEDFPQAGELSISLWLNPALSQQPQCILAYQDANFQLPLFSLNVQQDRLCPSMGPYMACHPGFEAGYQHLMLLFRANRYITRLEIYRNGELVANEQFQLSWLERQPGKWVLGKCWKQQHSGTFFKGTIDEMRVYNRLLNKAEIHALYQFERSAIQISSH